MNWRPAKRSKLTIVLALVVAAVSASVYFLQPTPPMLRDNNVEGGFQMGFYDVMSQKKEIYDISLKSTRGVMMANITSPDDNRFVLKGKFTPREKKRGKIYFNLSPIFYGSEKKGLMIDGLVDQLMYSNYWMEPVYLDNQSLVVGQNGTIFVYPVQN